MFYNIVVIGTGYVGLVQGTVFAASGNNVTCIDIDETKIEKLKKGISPIYEPGLDHILVKNQKEGRLHFSTDLEKAVNENLFVFLCLPTPPNEDGSADLQHVLKVAGQIAEIVKKNNIKEHRILINKSTVPVGTAEKVREILEKVIPGNDTIDVVSNPEFLREGFAVEDAMKPERVVVGTRSQYVIDKMRDLYEPFVRSGNPVIFMDEKSAEVTKYAANSFLSVKISFMNDLSAYCETVGADIENIRAGIGSDTRIGKRFLFAGIGYGGSCFPKDVRALMYSSENAGNPLQIIQAAHKVNDLQIVRFFNKIEKRFPDMKGMKFALWGLAFKPNTDDTREAPAFRLIDMLLEKGASVTAYDPEAMENTKMFKFGDKINYAENMYDCLQDADALIIATEWNVFRKPDFSKVKSMLKNHVIFDGRNLYQLDSMEELKFEYYCIGRRQIKP